MKTETIYNSEYDARKDYDDMLDDCYPGVDICGYKYSPSYALKAVDPIAYDCGFNDWLSSEDLNEEDDGSYSREE